MSLLSVARPADGPLDPELQSLPGPRRPWRRTTVATLLATLVSALLVGKGLLPLAQYALRTGAPSELGPLTTVQLSQGLANTWVHAVGSLRETSVEYRRPLDSDRYRLAQSAENPRVWIELRVPSEIEPEHYVAPNSFVGRLVPFGAAGLHHSALPGAAEAALGHAPPDDAWLLIDGEAPATTRWALGLVALFAAFAGFSAWGIYRILVFVPRATSGARG
jgi:hypothetical protein